MYRNHKESMSEDIQEVPVQEIAEETTPTELTKEESSQERNFKALREKADRLQRERDEYEKKLQEVEQRNTKDIEGSEEEYNLNPDDLVEWRHVEKKLKKLEGQIRKYQEDTSLSSSEIKLKSKYNDFDQVVTKGNIEQLRETYPEIADSIAANKDMYSAGSAAYTMIKKLGIYQEDHYMEEKEKAKSNSQKPRPASSVGQQGESALSQANAFANGLTPELKKQLWSEMNQHRKAY